MACIGLLASMAHAAEAMLPDIDSKYVTLRLANPQRDGGYVVGDKLERTVILTIRKPYQLVKESLPIVGYEHRYRGQISGVELADISSSEAEHKDGATHTIRLTYQVFTVGKLVKPAVLRAEIVKIRNTQTKDVLQYRIPSFYFRISPLSVFGQVDLKDDMSPFRPPFLLDKSHHELYLKLLVGFFTLSLIGLLYIYGARHWLPKMGGAFGKAYRDIKKIPDTPEGIQQTITRLHQAINKTAGVSIFHNNLADLFIAKPGYLVAKPELERFFNLSKHVFFDQNAVTDLGGAPPRAWLRKFCRQMRDCERGLKPEVRI
jgi:mxaA protein